MIVMTLIEYIDAPKEHKTTLNPGKSIWINCGSLSINSTPSECLLDDCIIKIIFTVLKIYH